MREEIICFLKMFGSGGRRRDSEGKKITLRMDREIERMESGGKAGEGENKGWKRRGRERGSWEGGREEEVERHLKTTNGSTHTHKNKKEEDNTKEKRGKQQQLSEKGKQKRKQERRCSTNEDKTKTRLLRSTHNNERGRRRGEKDSSCVSHLFLFLFSHLFLLLF